MSAHMNKTLLGLVREIYEQAEDENGYLHVQRVSEYAVADSGGKYDIDHDLYVAAVCHDLLEDFPLATFTQLATQFPFTDRQIDTISALTRSYYGIESRHETYQDYILSLRQHPLAARVKTYDLFDHLSPSQAATLSDTMRTRYLGALAVLTEKGIYV